MCICERHVLCMTDNVVLCACVHILLRGMRRNMTRAALGTSLT